MESSTRGWVVPSTTQAFSLTVDLTGEGTASQEALYSQEDVDFSGISSKVQRFFEETDHWNKNVYGETLVKLFCCELMLIIVCNYFIFFSVTLGKLTHFATDSAPHQPADPWASASSKSTGQWRDVGGRVQHPAPGCPLRECNGLLVVWVVTSCKKLTRTCIITLRNYIYIYIHTIGKVKSGI